MNLESRRAEVYKHSFFPSYYFKAINNKRRREKPYFRQSWQDRRKTEKLLINQGNHSRVWRGNRVGKIPYEKN